MNTPTLQGEAIIREYRANLMRGIEGVGGKLYITNQRLIFESHSFNIQSGNEIINLRDISAVEKVWTKILGIPLAPNGLKVTTATDEYSFVVGKRSEVFDLLNKSNFK